MSWAYGNTSCKSINGVHQNGATSIYRKLGDTRNDLTAINDVIKGPNDRSRAIIGTTFGQAAADHLAGSAEREAAFAKTTTTFSAAA